MKHVWWRVHSLVDKHQRPAGREMPGMAWTGLSIQVLLQAVWRGAVTSLPRPHTQQQGYWEDSGASSTKCVQGTFVTLLVLQCKPGPNPLDTITFLKLKAAVPISCCNK